MISYKNEWGEEVIVYVDHLPTKVKITFAKKNRTDMFCVPNEQLEEFITLIRGEE